jgi:RimJ/RimL family protein N-acetyltransferase
MFLKDDNLVIRNATSNDAQTLCNWWNDGKVMSHAGFPNGLGTTPQAIAQEVSKDSDDTRRRLILEIDAIPVGEMCYYNKGGSIAEIGIKICDFERQEKGFGTRFLEMLIGYLLYEKRYEKIILDTNLDNKRAQHVYEKLGFKQVAVRIDSWENQLGERQSAVDYELTREDFLKV